MTRHLPHLWASGTIWVSGSPPAELSFAEPLFGNDNIPDGGHRQIKFIPANVEAEITATTAFGAKYVDLIYPDKPSQRRLAAGAMLVARNVSIGEVPKQTLDRVL